MQGYSKVQIGDGNDSVKGGIKEFIDAIEIPPQFEVYFFITLT